MRFQLPPQHVDRGRILRQSGDIAGALNQFTRALEIDPGNEAAAQEIQITERQDKAPGATSRSPRPPCRPGSPARRQRGRRPDRPQAHLQRPITLHTIGDTKDIYIAIGKIAGLNVLFDPDYTSRRIPLTS